MTPARSLATLSGMTVTFGFYGAAATVTGSATRIEYPGGCLLVDCGLFQGSKTLKELNYQPFPFDAAALDAVLLTHAHIDHSGQLPKLMLAGFGGPVFATEGSRDLLTYMLPDAGYIQETEVEHLNRRRAQRGEPPVVPIYTRADGEKLVEQVRPVALDRWIDLPAGGRGGAQARFWNAGHILGSASVELALPQDGRAEPFRMVFSGDIGPDFKAFHAPSDGPRDVDAVVIEATYGDRVRPRLTPAERQAQLAEAIDSGLKAGGNVLIPAFAIERTQELLQDLDALFDTGRLREVPVFIDSPLAIQATRVFQRHLTFGADGSPFQRRNYHYTLEPAASKALNRWQGGAIILAASGMCDAGRIRHHLKSHLYKPATTVILVGYQAPGTLGQLLKAGEKRVRIMGEEVAVRARIISLEGYSAHGDQTDLVEWVAARLPIRRGIVLTHGEPEASAALAERLRREIPDCPAIFIPSLGDRLRVAASGALRLGHDAAVPKVSPETARHDWHNEYAGLLLSIGEQIRSAPPGDRQRLIRRLQRALDRKGR